MRTLESYKTSVKNQLHDLGLAFDDIDNIVDSTEGSYIVDVNFRHDCSVSICVDEILQDAPDHVLDQIG